MIQVNHLYKTFDETRLVLNDITHTFETGKVNLIIGQSGSGKTVLLKSLVGLHQVDKGEIFYDDILFNTANFQQKKLLQQHSGMLFQGGALFDALTVEENVRFPLDVFTNKSLEEKREIVNQCLKKVRLEDAHTLYPSELSGGMVKRASIARAIVVNPKYLFCDEPNSGLDPKTSIVIDNLIHEITHEYNMTTVINTHDMNSVMEIGETILFIFEGKKWWEGSNENILQSDNKELNSFVFASRMAKKAKQNL